MIEVTVVIASRNGARTLGATLESLLAQRTNRAWEIVLADNGSTDGTRAVFETALGRGDAPQWRVVDASARAGKSFALNTAIRDITAPKILVIDDDDLAAPGWLEALAAALDLHAFVHAVQEWRRLNSEATVEARPQEPVDWRYWRPPFSRLAPGGTHGFRREVFDAVGGFDETFDALGDLRFCIEAHLKGYDLVSVPEAVVHYRLRADAAGIYRQHWRYGRGTAQLRRCYPSGSPLLGPWKILMLSLQLIRLGVEGAASRLRGVARDSAAAADFARRSGLALGDLSGAIAFRVAPAVPGPRFLKLLRRGTSPAPAGFPRHPPR